MNMLEYEKKLIITQREYENIVTEYLPSKTIRQTNYYYDTENLSLNRAGITFRIREIEDVLTVNVYVYYNGNNANVTTANAANLQNTKLDITFGVKNATQQPADPEGT